MSEYECQKNKTHHNFCIKMHCRRCDRVIEVIIRDRPCKRQVGETHELKRVVCRQCKNIKNSIKMYFKCVSGWKDHERYTFAEITVTNIDK